MGGATLSIEAVKGAWEEQRVQAYRQAWDVMQESASIALSHVHSRAKNYGIDESYFDDSFIHIHVPEGATPKDGPSAASPLPQPWSPWHRVTRFQGLWP